MIEAGSFKKYERLIVVHCDSTVQLKRLALRDHLSLDEAHQRIGSQMSLDEKKRYATFAEVLDYCRRSANPVGRIVLMIHGYRDEELFRYSDAICTALQLANFWQDVSVDLKKDRIYLPEEDFAAHGYSEADLRMGVYNERFKNLMKFEVSRTRSLFEQGRPLVKRLAWPLSLEIRLTWLGGMQILKLIHRLDFDTLRTRPALKKRDWIPLAARALAGA